MKRVLEQSLTPDIELLYKDVADIPVNHKLYGGVVSAISEQAFTAAADAAGRPVIAAARYGRGRILVSGVETGFNRAGSVVPGSGAFIANMLHWLTEESGAYRQALAGQGPLQMATTASPEAFDAGSGLPIEVARLSGWSAAESGLSGYAVAYADRSVTEEDAACLDAYIKGGGSLLVHAKGWELEWEPEEELQQRIGDRQVKVRDYPLQRLLNRAGSPGQQRHLVSSPVLAGLGAGSGSRFPCAAANRTGEGGRRRRARGGRHSVRRGDSGREEEMADAARSGGRHHCRIDGGLWTVP